VAYDGRRLPVPAGTAAPAHARVALGHRQRDVVHVARLEQVHGEGRVLGRRDGRDAQRRLRPRVVLGPRPGEVGRCDDELAAHRGGFQLRRPGGSDCAVQYLRVSAQRARERGVALFLGAEVAGQADVSEYVPAAQDEHLFAVGGALDAYDGEVVLLADGACEVGGWG